MSRKANGPIVSKTRRGLYVMPETRERINALRDRLSREHGYAVNQDRVISLALSALERELDTWHQTRQPTSTNHPGRLYADLN